MDFGLFIQKLENQLKLELPGENAQWRMAPVQRKALMENYYAGLTDPKKSAVLICLYPYQDSVFTLLTLRPAEFGIHSDQISFPGGKYEVSDLNLEATAFRETKEELGIDGNLLSIIGMLTPVYIPVSNFIVFPFIASADKRPDFILNEMEVKQVIETDLTVFLDDSIKSISYFLSPGRSIEAPYYGVKQQKIWGATAMILSEFEEILRPLFIHS
ncbi:MAG: CoA pyrophosphatase [Chitinophagales bacterium]